MLSLLFSGVVSGVAIGLLFGLLAFAVVLVFKATGVANFAEGNMAMFAAFVVYELIQQARLSLPLAVAVGVAFAALLGVAVYVLALRPRDNAGPLNLTIRTLGVYLLLFAIAQRLWAIGGPFPFPSLFPRRTIPIGTVSVPLSSVGILAVSLALTSTFAYVFQRTKFGLLVRAMADDAGIARLLGARTRLLTGATWLVAGVTGLIVGVLAAPNTLVSPEMMDLYLLSSFTAAIIGGLTSLPGAILGGITVGVIENVASIEAGNELAIVPVFILLVFILLVRPNGLFGRDIVSRL